jgi:hypothetical protein
MDADITLIDKRKHVMNSRAHYVRAELLSLLVHRTPAVWMNDVQNRRNVRATGR